MANLDELTARVNSLNPALTGDSKFKEVFEEIQEAVGAAGDDDLDALLNIAAAFRNKLLNGKVTLNRVRADAKDLHEALTLGSIEAAIGRMELRNDAISKLTDALDKERLKGNSDAKLLTDILDAVNKATKTVNVIKDMVNNLNASGSGVIEDLTTLIDSAGEISSIFNPNAG